MTRRRGRRYRALAAGIATVIGLAAAAVASPRPAPSAAAAGDLVVAARPLDVLRPAEPQRRIFGRLEFLGGLVLTSPDPAFGSLSGLSTRDHGREWLAVGDEGTWVTGRLETDDHGRPLAVRDAKIGRIRDEAGRPYATKRLADAESLALRPTAHGLEALVGFEGRHRIDRHRSAGDFAGLFAAAAEPVAGLPRDIRRLPGNAGLEAIALAPPATPLAGTLVLLAEDPRPGEIDIPGWLVGGPRPGAFHLSTTDGWSATDAAFLADGDLLVLQRRLAWLSGFHTRLMRLAAADLADGATITGEVLFEADWSHEIDNMEGLAVDTAPDGSTVLTLVSDDNGNWFQRTVLLRFRLLSEGAATAAARANSPPD